MPVLHLIKVVDNTNVKVAGNSCIFEVEVKLGILFVVRLWVGPEAHEGPSTMNGRSLGGRRSPRS